MSIELLELYLFILQLSLLEVRSVVTTDPSSKCLYGMLVITTSVILMYHQPYEKLYRIKLRSDDRRLLKALEDAVILKGFLF